MSIKQYRPAVSAGYEDAVRIARDRDVAHLGILRIGDRQLAAQVVGRDRGAGGAGGVGHLHVSSKGWSIGGGRRLGRREPFMPAGG